jgi:hypothetical protein
MAEGHFVEDAAQVPDEFGVNNANPAAMPRHNQPGEHKSAFNNQTAAGATTTSYRPPSPRWSLWTFNRPTRNPPSNSTPNTKTGQPRNRYNNVNHTTFSTSEALDQRAAS